MKSILGKALVTAGAALALAAVAAPAQAHEPVTAGGGGQYVTSAEPHNIFAAGEVYGFAETAHSYAAGLAFGWATDTSSGGGFEGVAGTR
ncbi:hypothetical protein [Streptomyces qinzhouensis]|uniref:Porin family protein n=1 Tax=Streptomyces qinzhouensis TaxID=2599401 RepID=A0A5B8JI41_9ACTN|nr:hypothetical protein [Streptomyces qinzhouensis]QDY77183.1 hypothetical protein FQU76_12390 [Streptomyces qinzhouensis]